MLLVVGRETGRGRGRGVGMGSCALFVYVGMTGLRIG